MLDMRGRLYKFIDDISGTTTIFNHGSKVCERFDRDLVGHHLNQYPTFSIVKMNILKHLNAGSYNMLVCRFLELSK